MPGPLEIKSERSEHALWVSLEGELDLRTEPPVREFISDCLGRDKADLVLDLTDLEFIDSTGLALLVRASRASEQTGQRFVVVGSSPQVRRVFELTGLGKALALVHSRDEAEELVSGER